MSDSTKILIVDDEPIGIQLLEAILVPEGYELAYGKDGEEAFNVALKEHPDIILLDVMMPKMDGFEVCKKLRENDSTAHIPVYLITALDDRDSRIRGIDAGAYDYISKPFDRIEILAKIKNITKQIKLQKKNMAIKGAESKIIPQHDQFSEDLISALVQTVLEYEADSEYFQLYRSNKPDKSVHACLRKKTEKAEYTVFISNKLEGNNAIVSNCIFKIILFNNIEKADGQLKKIIQHSFQDLNNLIEKRGIKTLNKADFSVLIIYRNLDTNEIIASGLNQHIFVLEENSIINQNQNPAYQMYYLQNNQEIKFEEAKGIIAFSPVVYEKINQKELLASLNNSQNNPCHIDLEKLVKEKLSTIPDLLILKLTF